jgi:hypothetical protein
MGRNQRRFVIGALRSSNIVAHQCAAMDPGIKALLQRCD